MTASAPDHWLRTDTATRSVAPGDDVLFGRSVDCDLRIGAEDRLVSRHAGRVVVHAERTEVFNLSRSRELRLRPPVGPDVVVEPERSVTNWDLPVFEIRVLGEWGAAHAIACRVPASSVPAGTASTDGGEQTMIRPFDLSAAERRAVRALCRPLLVANGEDAAPATYGEVGRAIGVSEGRARNVLNELRERLSDAGIPGLRSDGRTRNEDFRAELCRFSIANGWAFEDDDA